ncbi:Xaa-Pro peptidase family protein [Microbacterium capsulatum]|uniref:Xaa-Pro peptidase family protein n=1 Tax=Microbacterium capsulatum TaxID=3041921 RepID=A0ABU0XGW4_9MICO|nr:Xaa-Pro peptidase family protein [Microbacterium sp. ASV81]MDQ4214311.1 Xaa-Pro peptidase family protein [Microbacterium sp. ASV81]
MSSTEQLLKGFEPDFEFVGAPPLAEAEYADRIRRVRRDATVAGYDAVVVHTGPAGWYHTTNDYLRYLCDWAREGVLIIPTDETGTPEIVSFWTETVLLPPKGEPVGIDDIWQVSPFGRESVGRPGSPLKKTVEAVADILDRLGLSRGSIGLIGDAQGSAAGFFTGIRAVMPGAEFANDNGIVDRMQRVRSAGEVALIRSAAQLIDIACQAAYHVTRPGVTDYEIYAAFTYAQLSRGGETGDGYQIGISRYGAHCGKPYGHVVRPGDLINLYVSNVSYHGYCAQTARMIAVGDVTEEQDRVLEMCTEGVYRAEQLIKPGARFQDLHNAAFSSYIERGYMTDAETRTMPYIWSALDDGSPRQVPKQYVEDEDWEAQGRKLMHVWPATKGPHNPNLGHAVGTPMLPHYNVTSHNTDVMEPGMCFVLHAQWLEPLVSGCNVGNMYVVTEDGFENLSNHTPLDTHRVEVAKSLTLA